MTDAKADRQLAAQYEAFPYPARDPREEASRLIVGSPSHLREIDHWIFGARRPAGQPLRALVAGGGTGDGTIMLAQQMAWAGRPGSVTWLDRSAAARKVAEARAAARKPGQYPLRGRLAAGAGRAPASAPSTTSIAAACCTTCRTRWPGCAPWSRCWRRAAGWG